MTTRYSLSTFTSNDPALSLTQMVGFPQGEWVKFEDYEELRKEYNNLRYISQKEEWYQACRDVGILK